MKVSEIFLAALFFCLSTPLYAKDSVSDSSIEAVRAPELNDAIALLEAGKPEKAMALYDSILASYERKYTEGVFFCADGATNALEVILQSIDPDKPTSFKVLGPTWCEALWGKGFALIDLNRSAEAEPFLVRAVSMAPTNAHYANELAELYKSRRDWQRAYDTFEMAFNRTSQDKGGPDSAVAARSLRGLGFTLIELKRLDEAEARFRQSLEYQPGHPGALSELEYIARKKMVGATK